MEYKGIELKEVTEPQLFDTPKKMFVWDKDYEWPATANVCAIINRKGFIVITENSTWQHCAEIPEEPKKIATNRELSRWLARGHGEVCISCYANTYWGYSFNADNDDIPKGVVVRKWDETEWHKPTREFLGLEDK